MNKHRYTVADFSNNLYITQHYSQEGHCFSKAHIQIIDYINDEEPDSTLELREAFWIKALNTAYPLGLNDNIRSHGNVSRGNAKNVYFIPQKIPRYKRGHGRQIKRRAGTMNVLTEAITLLRKFETSKTEFYKSLVSYKKSFVTSHVQNINSKKTFFEAIKYILDNSFVVFGNFVLKQNWGIPMGGNSSSEIADCTLGWFEFIYMKSLMNKKDWSKMNLAKLLSDNKRYVDDLISLNYIHFGDLYKDIYPTGLLMERNGNNNKVVNYLDLRIEFDGKGGFTTQVYNKLDDFNFPVIQYTFASGNMPNEVGHNVFFGEILRFSELCSGKSSFTDSVKKLYEMLKERGYQKLSLIRKFRKAFSRNRNIAIKYNVYDIRTLEKDIFGNTTNT